MKKGGLWLLIAAMAATAGASPGSILNSFPLSGNIYPIASAAYRDNTHGYVYGLFDTNGGAELRSYSVIGSLAGSVALAAATDKPLDAGASPLGSAYITVLGANATLRTYDLGTGSLVTSAAVSPANGFACDSQHGYTYFSRANTIYRYNSVGTLVGSFPGGTYAGTLAFSHFFNEYYGDYVIVLPSAQGLYPCSCFTDAGSLVSTFTFSGPYPTMDIRGGAACGAGHPYSFGQTLWVMVQTDFIVRSAYQIHIGNYVMAVVPASLGAIKTMYR